MPYAHAMVTAVNCSCLVAVHIHSFLAAFHNWNIYSSLDMSVTCGKHNKKFALMQLKITKQLNLKNLFKNQQKFFYHTEPLHS